MRPRIGFASVVVVLAVATGLAADPGPGPALPQIRGVIDFHGSRAPGSAGNAALEALVRQRFESSGFESGALVFEAPVFRPGATQLGLPDGSDIPIEPMHPTLLRPGNFSQRDFETRLVYLGRGGYDDLERAKGTELSGAVVVMEFDCGAEWLRLLRFGVRGFVFLAGTEYAYTDSAAKVYNSEVAVPRFFADASHAERLRDAARRMTQVRVRSEPSRWETTLLRSPWALVPGVDDSGQAEVVCVTAPLDANAIVPQRAAGARSAINLALMLDLLEHYRTQPPARSVLLVAVNAHTQRYLGERILAWHSAAPRDQVENIRNDLALEMRVARLYADNYRRLSLEPTGLDNDSIQVGMAVLSQFAAQAPSGELEDPSAYLLEQYRAAVDSALEFLEGTDDEDGIADRLRLGQVGDMGHAAWIELARRVMPIFDDEALFESWRNLEDDSTGRKIAVKALLQDGVKRRLNRVKQTLMAVAAEKTLPEAERKERLEFESERRTHLTRVLVMFNKYDIGVGRTRVAYRRIAGVPEQLELLRRFRDEIVAERDVWAERYAERMDLDTTNDSLRTAIGARRIVLAIHLSVNADAGLAGFCSLDPGAHMQAGWARGFGLVSTRTARNIEGRESAAPWIDTMTGIGGHSEAFYFHSLDAPSSCFHAAEGVPAVALKSVFAGHGATFSPDDTFERLPQGSSRLAPWLLRYLPVLIDERALTGSDSFKPLNATRSGRLFSSAVRTFYIDQFSGKTQPDQPVPGSLVAAYPNSVATTLIDGDVVNTYSGLSDVTGTTILFGMNSRETMGVTAYQLGANRREVRYAVDKGRVQSSEQLTSILRNVRTIMVPMFPCTEIPILDRADPSRMRIEPITVMEIWPQSAAIRSQPQKFGLHGVSSQRVVSHPATGPAATYLWRKDTVFRPERMMLITDRYGCAINADAQNPEGTGFRSSAELGPDLWRVIARDMGFMNRARYTAMTGVANELVDDFLETGARRRGEADQAARARDHTTYRKAVYAGLGAQTKAYTQLRAMNSDMLKAIICYMALMVPFCFFLQKLLFHYTRLEHELLAFVLMFISIYVVFRFIHPAFALATNPEAIFIAFLLGAIGSFITWVLHAKFRAQMQLLFSSATGIGEDAAYGVVGQTAALVGVNNMKRRRVRTILTTGTIVLVVFTMLAFSSVSKKLQPTFVRKAPTAPYTGLLYHWPGAAPMDEESRRVIEDLYGGEADIHVRRVAHPESPIPEDSNRFSLRRTAAVDRGVGLQAVLGLPLMDKDLLGGFPLVEGRFFSDNRARELILPVGTADGLGLKPADVGTARLELMGQSFLLVGLVDDSRYRLIRDLNPNLPLLPGVTASASTDDKVAVETVDTSALAIVPEGTAQQLGARPFMVGVRFRDGATDAENLWDHASRLLTATQARFHVGSEHEFPVGEGAMKTVRAGSYYVGSGYRTAVGGLSRMLVPLVLAGLLILNTMLGTVYERKAEIGVYNAIGLNPTHIFIFFLAEAFVYGVIGSVGGYLIGQILAITIKSTGLVEGINVNFSSLIVVYTIAFTIALVLVSTIYPGIVATRTAVPSGKRRWSLPVHDGNQMQVDFPFIYEPRLVPGVMHYIHADFADRTELSLGDLVVTPLHHEQTSDENDRPVYNLEYSIALAPFDLGVTQTVVFRGAYDARVDSYRVDACITRTSGQDTNWVTTNQPFLERMRKFLIRWRNMDATQHGWHVERGQELFGG